MLRSQLIAGGNDWNETFKKSFTPGEYGTLNYSITRRARRIVVALDKVIEEMVYGR